MFDFEYLKDIVKRNILAISGVAFGLVSLMVSIGIVVFNSKDTNEVKEDNTLIGIKEEVPSEKVEEEQTPQKVKIDIKGAVKKPGVYELAVGSTVNDGITLAGGVTSKGVTSNINLSKRVKDEMVVYVFTKAELAEKKSANEVVCEVPKCECETITIEECPSNNASETKNPQNQSTNSSRVSINKATLEQLLSLDGIGESKAKAIIEYREKNGLFKELEDIKNVSGIGEQVYEKIKDKIEL